MDRRNRDLSSRRETAAETEGPITHMMTSYHLGLCRSLAPFRDGGGGSGWWTAAGGERRRRWTDSVEEGGGQAGRCQGGIRDVSVVQGVEGVGQGVEEADSAGESTQLDSRVGAVYWNVKWFIMLSFYYTRRGVSSV